MADAQQHVLPLDLETTQLPNQSACAVVDRISLKMVRGNLPPSTVSVLVEMMMQLPPLSSATNNNNNESFRRMSVTLSRQRFVLSADQKYVYIASIV